MYLTCLYNGYRCVLVKSDKLTATVIVNGKPVIVNINAISQVMSEGRKRR